MTTTTSLRSRPRTRRPGVVAETLARPLADYYLLLVPTVLLLGLGSLMVLSSSSLYAESIGQNPYSIAGKQMLFLLMGIPLMWWLSRQAERVLKPLSGVAIGLALFLLLAVAVAGTNIKGNKAWLVIGPISIQPSEFAKLALIMFCALVVSAKEKVLDRPKEIAPIFLAFFLIVGLVLVEHDLGSTLVFAMIFFAILFTIGTQGRLLLSFAALAVLGVVAMVIVSPNRMTRIFSFLGSDTDPNASQQPLSSVYAIATGGWWGLGLGASRQKWGALADGAQNDFIFAVVGEELGLLGTVSVLCLFGVIGWAGLRVAMRSDTIFSRVLAAGCTAWIIGQALLNIAVAMRMLPVAGVPLPFISAGGTALVANMMAAGVLLGCARREPAARRLLAIRRGEAQPRVSTVVDAGK